MTTLIQRSFSGGEIAPALYGRVDMVKYSTGLRTCRNFIVQKHGGIANRPGTQFVGEVSDSTKKVRLIPFIFNAEQTFVLEFGEQYMRVIKDGAHILETAQTITGVTQANPAVMTVASHGLSTGDEIYVTGVGGMTELNNRNFKVTVLTASTFELEDMSGTDIDSTGFGAYTSGGTAAKVFEVSSDYLEDDLSTLQYIQSADIVTLVHNNYPPAEVARIADDNWTLTDISFVPDTPRTTGISATAGAAGSNTFRYKVTVINSESLEESLPAKGASDTITGATQANPIVITATGHSFSNGDEVLIEGIVGMTEINNRTFTVANVAVNTFELEDEDGTGYTAYTSGGTAFKTEFELTSAADPTPSVPHTITWDASPDAIEYNVYRASNGVFGLIGIAGETSFKDVDVEPDTTSTPPIGRNPFFNTGNYPSTVTYFQQRLCFGNTDNSPEKIFMSKIGNFKNFSFSSPLQDDDAVTFTMAGRQVNQIRHLLDLGRFIIFTTGGEWTADGDDAGIITPVSINTRQHTYNGSNTLQPIIINGTALYTQARGSIVRDLGFEVSSDGYTGSDLTIFSTHLFQDYTLVDWAYSQVPDSLLWAVRSDGVLLCLTYVREHQVWAWHRHDFEGGTVENVTVVPEGNEDILYVVVKRTINGRVTKYIERFTTRQVVDVIDSKFMDSNLSFDGRNTDTGHTMTLSGGTTWEYTETLTLTSSTSFFTAADVGNQIQLTDSEGTTIRFTIDAFTSGTVVTGKPHKTVPTGLRSVAVSDWCKAVDEISGLWHLEGKEVSVFGDRFVVANPNNDSYDTITVTDGKISLADPACVVHVGLPYTSDAETLDPDTAQGETISDKKKNIAKVSMFVEKSRGVFVGTEPPDETVGFLDGLNEVKLRDDETHEEPVQLKTGVIETSIRPNWNEGGRVFIRQTDPIPLNILAIAPAGLLPFRG